MSTSEPTDPKDPPCNYEVGYGKPPVHTRFKPGRSGNPKGRPKGTKNLKTDLLEELSERITIREGDHTRKVSKQRALIKNFVARGLKGDVRLSTLLVSMMMRLLDTGEGVPEAEDALNGDEREILDAFKARIQHEYAQGLPEENSDDDDLASAESDADDSDDPSEFSS